MSKRDRSGLCVSDLSDEELIARCAGGDRSAMDVLVSRYHGKLLDFALRHLGDRETSADIAQTTLVRAFQSAGTYRTKATFKTWLYTIAFNLVREEFRTRSRRKESLLSDLEDRGELAPQEPADDRSPEDLAIGRIASQALWRAVDELPEQHRSAVILRFRVGLNYREISVVMGAPSGTVKSWVHYALKALRKSLEPTKCEG
jgi:RNA polymerase sigma-70 factor (ECF subfamily)